MAQVGRKEGPEHALFAPDVVVHPGLPREEIPVMQMIEEKILSRMRYPTGEDVSIVKSQGISVDDDNVFQYLAKQKKKNQMGFCKGRSRESWSQDEWARQY